METTTAAGPTAKQDVFGIITGKIIAELEHGTVPWQQPWTTGGLPNNLITKRRYRGINVLLLASSGYEHNLFLTFEQLKDIGGKVRKGEKGHQIIYWSQAKESSKQKDEATEPDDSKKKSVLRYYYVFNISQCDTIPERYLPQPREATVLPKPDAIVKAMPKCPVIKHKEQKAYYDVVEDFVNMPKKRSFATDAAYYSTLFHELVHSTGHHDRLDRKGVVEMSEFAGAIYSQEELVAEIGTCYLQSFAGITTEFANSTAYIQGWLSKLKNDKRFIFTAATLAQKAVDYILDIQDGEEEKQE